MFREEIKHNLGIKAAKRVGTIPLDTFTKKEKNKIIKALKEIWNDNKNTVTNKRIRQALDESAIPVEWANEINDNYQTWGGGSFKAALTAIALSAGNQQAELLNDVTKKKLTYDVTNQEMVNYLNTEVTRITPQFNSQTDEGLRIVINESVINGYTAAFTKELAEKSMTLTAKETQAIINEYKRIFEANLNDLVSQGVPLRDAKKRADEIAKKAMNRKHRALTATRAERIYNSEIVDVKGKAETNTFGQAIAIGAILAARKTWDRTNTIDNWDSSIINDGVTLPLNGSFVIPSGSTMTTDQYPSEINEKCILKYSVEV